MFQGWFLIGKPTARFSYQAILYAYRVFLCLAYKATGSTSDLCFANEHMLLSSTDSYGDGQDVGWYKQIGSAQVVHCLQAQEAGDMWLTKQYKSAMTLPQLF